MSGPTAAPAEQVEEVRERAAKVRRETIRLIEIAKAATTPASSPAPS